MRVNSQSRILEEKFITYGIPYRLYGGFKFFERKEIKDITAYLRLIHNPYDDEATRRMLAFPKKGIGDSTVAQLEVLAEDNGVSLYNLIVGDFLEGAIKKKLEPVKELMLDLKDKADKMPLYEFVEYAINKVDFKGAIGDKSDEDQNKQMNVDDFLLSVKEFSDANTTADLEEYLQSITLMRDIDSLNEEEDFASLITVHAAKGLEFNVVFIVGLNDGLFPLSRAINSDDENELEEERRLMYVAITRAKKRLYLTRAKTRFSFESKRTEYSVPSRFLKELEGQDADDDAYLPKERKTSLSSLTVSSISKNNIKQTNTARNTDYSKFTKGTKVRHPHFGVGEITLEVTDFAAAFVTIKFESVGIKTLSLKYANLEIIE